MESVLHSLIRFSEDYPKIYAMALSLTENVSILGKICENRLLFYRAARYCDSCKLPVYMDVRNALYNFREKIGSDDDCLLIQISEISMYIIFRQEEYMNFLQNLSFRETGGVNRFEIHQLVLSGRKQKFAFICTDKVNFDRLKKYAGECFFGSDQITSRDQITINIECNSESDIFDNYSRLYNYISDAGDEICVESMKQLHLYTDFLTGIKYRKYACDDNIDNCYSKEFSKLLRSIHKEIPKCQINIINNYGGCNTVNNVSSTDGRSDGKSDGKVVARNWIARNPPRKGQSSAEYYKKYVSENNEYISIQNFTKEVLSMGYKKRHGKNNYWTAD